MAFGQGLHASLHHPVSRAWSEPYIRATDLVYPLFVTDKLHDKPIANFEPNIQWGCGENGDYPTLIKHLKSLQEIGLSSVMLYGVVLEKDEKGSKSKAEDTPVIKVTKLLRKQIPSLMVLCDVCLCDYTDHGHCGWLKEIEHESEKIIDNSKSIDFLAEVALEYAKSGAHWVCPSDMLDGRIKTIRNKLDAHGYNHVGIMAYTSKKASVMYAPFRDAVDSTLKGDRKRYQQPIGSTVHALQALRRDEHEGASVVLVKPALFYADIIKTFSDNSILPVACYIVSGEYVMLQDYAKRTGDLENVIRESHMAMKRAGGSILITYYTPQILELIKENKM